MAPTSVTICPCCYTQGTARRDTTDLSGTASMGMSFVLQALAKVNRHEVFGSCIQASPSLESHDLSRLIDPSSPKLRLWT